MLARGECIRRMPFYDLGTTSLYIEKQLIAGYSLAGHITDIQCSYTLNNDWNIKFRLTYTSYRPIDNLIRTTVILVLLSARRKPKFFNHLKLNN